MSLEKSEEETLQPGDKAPEFELKRTDEEIVSRDDFAGAPMVVIFMCNHCPYVKAKMAEIAKLQQEFDDVHFVLINSNDAKNYPEDSFRNMKVVAQQYEYDNYLFDETQDVAKAYGAVCTPDPFIFDENHELVYHGRINDAMKPGDTPDKRDMKEVLEAIQSGEAIDDWFRPSMGCSIKWKE
jgi:peroxiredoxin